MDKTLNENDSNKTTIIVLCFILLGFAFYWFGLRPSNIRRECSLKAMEQSVFDYSYGIVELHQEALEVKLYNSCLSKSGLK